MARQYCVVLGDVVASRDITDRESFQKTARETFRAINDEHNSYIRADFSYIKGIDEFGGVLTSVAPVAAIQRTLSRSMHPEQLRLAAAVGEIDITMEPGNPASMDGPAFATAARVLTEIERDGDTFRLDGTEPLVDGVISDQITLLDVIRQRWSERKMEVVRASERNETQTAVAETLGITRQAVSNHLREVRPVLRIEERLDAHLAEYPSLVSEV